MEFEVASTWDGEPALDESVTLRVWLDELDVHVEVDAPYWGDPRPVQLPGHVDQLWEYEVVELFLLGDNERYLEIEMGPHGHYLVLRLSGRRQVERQGLLMEYEVHISEGRWHGQARLPRELLPPNVRRGNAYAMHGMGDARRYLAAFPAPGELPDFHRLDCFGIIELG